MTEMTNYLTQIQLSKLERYKLVFHILNLNKAQENLILCKLTPIICTCKLELNSQTLTNEQLNIN